MSEELYKQLFPDGSKISYPNFMQLCEVLKEDVVLKDNIDVDEATAAFLEERQKQIEMCNNILKPIVSEISEELNSGASADEVAKAQGGVWHHLYTILSQRFGIDLFAIERECSMLTKYTPKKVFFVINIMCVPLVTDIARRWLADIRRKRVGGKPIKDYMKNSPVIPGGG